MDATAVSLLALFETRTQLEVPLFQRQYVWHQEQHWEPLWDDIKRKFEEYLNGRKDAPVHFLGAIVLDLKQTPVSHVGKRQIIDGQQRLTTFQILLAALRDFCGENGCSEMAKECEEFTLNRGRMDSPDLDKFKVWPTLLDREQFSDVITSGSRAELMRRHPRRRKPYSRRDEPRPRMVEAYFFFFERLNEFFKGTEEEPPIAAELPLAQRIDECILALRSALQVVEIDLESGDDAQVIFETLNARGEPLLPADLLRNFIFLRAARLGENKEQLYNRHWIQFEEPFWREAVKQGRLIRPRSDLFMQHFLSSRSFLDIPVKHLFVEYKFWIEHSMPFDSVEGEVACLARQGKDFKRIISPKDEDPLKQLAVFLDVFDVRTCYPLLLSVLDAQPSDENVRAISSVVESYLLRRAVCGLTTKGYNRIFLDLTKTLKGKDVTGEALATEIRLRSGESAEWPSDERFKEAWRTMPAYTVLNNPKIVYILRRLSETYMTVKNEHISVSGALSVEHILPQKWQDKWLLPDGKKGLSEEALWNADAVDSVAMATRKRNEAAQRIGNLTILTQSLNSSVSNSEWKQKKPELLKHSLLPINQQLYDAEKWDETAIENRTDELFTRALTLWPR